MQRVCQHCDLNEIGIACNAIQHIRERHAALFSVSIVTVLDFMWQADLVGVAIFVMNCLDFSMQMWGMIRHLIGRRWL